MIGYFVTGYSLLVAGFSSQINTRKRQWDLGIKELRNCEFRNWGFEGLHFGYLLGSREQAVGISNFRHFSSL